MSHHSFIHHMDADFGVWRDKKISKALKQWDERDKMTCDHVEPGKEVKYPNLLGLPLDYTESCRVFKSIKTSEYNLCHFYKVGLSGDFPEFPTPVSLPPATMCMVFWRKSGSFPGQTYLWHTRRMQSQFACFENSMPMPAFDTLRWRLMLRQVAKLRGSCHSGHSVNTQVATTHHTSTISSVHITMCVMGVESA